MQAWCSRSRAGAEMAGGSRVRRGHKSTGILPLLSEAAQFRALVKQKEKETRMQWMEEEEEEEEEEERWKK